MTVSGLVVSYPTEGGLRVYVDVTRADLEAMSVDALAALSTGLASLQLAFSLPRTENELCPECKAKERT